MPILDVDAPEDEAAPGDALVCSLWCGASDVTKCGPCSTGVFDADLMDEAITVASDLLYLLTGKQYPGICTETDLRPTCVATPLVDPRHWLAGDAGARRDVTDAMRLYGLPVALIPVFRIVEVLEVKVDGIVLDPSAYMILDDRWLARMDGDGWPVGQDFGKPSTAQGTFSVSVSAGAMPPPAGKRAAAAYACQFLKACAGDSSCSLPLKTQSISRQGLSAKVLDIDDYLENGKTGVPEADRFIGAVNPNGLTERAVVLSPDTSWPAHRFR